MKRRFLFLSVVFLTALSAVAQSMVWTQRYQDYFDRYKELAIEQMVKHRIPASITLAQGVLESAAGRSELAINGNNHFGIKCNGWRGRTTYHDDDARNECFRAYDNVYQSYEDHSVFLTSSKRYSRLFELKLTDYKGWARGLKACGYATSPTYASKLIEIIQLYRLYEYDTAKGYDKFQTQQIEHGDLRHIYHFNKNYYLLARRGDTFRLIAQEVGISYRKLARYNERDKNDQLEEGEVVWLEKKRSKAPKEYKNRPHLVQAGESMYSIAQKYGIRLKKLYKMNGLTPDYQLRVGDRLRVR
ncbi:MAG: glucosaminidase domain-containing protein [Prevotella sp.]|nr:glucosaminidase domain-containing protein [Prevotella sp.]